MLHSFSGQTGCSQGGDRSSGIFLLETWLDWVVASWREAELGEVMLGWWLLRDVNETGRKELSAVGSFMRSMATQPHCEWRWPLLLYFVHDARWSPQGESTILLVEPFTVEEYCIIGPAWQPILCPGSS